VSCGLCENGDVFHYVSFDAVRTSAIESIQPQLLQVLRELAEEGFDMPRMATVIHRCVCVCVCVCVCARARARIVCV